MVFEPVYETLKAEGLTPAIKAQAVVEAQLTPPEGVEIKQILSVSAVSAVSAAEVFAGEARYNGRVDFTALYVDSAGAVGVMETRAEFSDKIAAGGIGPKTDAFFCSSVLDVDASKCTEREFSPACVVEVMLFCSLQTDVHCLIECTGDVFRKEDKASLLTKVASGRQNFEVSVTHSDSAIEKLLTVNCALCYKGADISEGVIEAEGEIVLSYIGLAGGVLVEENAREPFRREIEAGEAARGDMAAVFLQTEDVGTRGISEDGVQTYETTLNIGADFAVFSVRERDIVADLFSLSVDVLAERQTETVCENVSSVVFGETISGNVTLDIGNAPVDNVLCFAARKANVTNCYAGKGVVTAEGIVSGCVVYFSEDIGKICSVNVELPFSVTKSADVNGGENVFLSACVTAHSIRVRRANELNIKAEVCFFGTALKSAACPYISSVTENGEKSKNSAALTVHLAAKGEGIWEVAKSAGCPPDDIMRQNPDLTLPLQGGERILIYRSVKEKF